MLTAHLQAILTFDPIKHETRCQKALRTYMATVIEDVRKRDKEKYADHSLYTRTILVYLHLLKIYLQLSRTKTAVIYSCELYFYLELIIKKNAKHV